MIILNEKEYAEKCLKTGVPENNPFEVISIIAKYYYHFCGYRKKRISTLLLEFLTKFYPVYEVNKFSWQNTIDKVAANVGKYPFHQISGVKITRTEMDTISSIHNELLERLMFTMLCLAKLNNLKNPNNNGWVNFPTKEIFTLARIGCSLKERYVKIAKLKQLNLLELPKRNDNLNCRVTFINDDDDEVLFISDFRELGYEYMFYCGGNFIRCGECGILARNSKNGLKKYCNKCRKPQKQETKTVVCEDCGFKFEAKTKNNKSTRCKGCQHEFDKKRKREWKRDNKQ